uniref:Type III endosome membrane protein TEMP n=1 Tax=Dicentrarchus labrax TaxID=13489 RepID=A0A8C4HY16_DICLA
MVPKSKRQVSSNKRQTEPHRRSHTPKETAQTRAKPDGTIIICPRGKYTSHKWEFLVAVLVTSISLAILVALLAKCQVVRRYLASYRHTRLRETDTVRRGINPHSLPPVCEEDDDGFIEDNYIPATLIKEHFSIYLL